MSLRPITINLQIIIDPTTGDVKCNTGEGVVASRPVDQAPATPLAASVVATLPPAADGPTDSDMRTALLAAIKATDKAAAAETVKRIAGVAKISDIPADQGAIRAAVYEALKELAKTVEATA